MKLMNSEGVAISERNLGVVEVGTKKIYEYWIVNEEPCTLTEIKVSFEDSPLAQELRIVECPANVGPNSKSKILIEWAPNLKVKAGLNLKMNVRAVEVYG